MKILNLVGNAYYFINDWFETKRHNIYVRFAFEPTTILFGVEIVSLRLFTIYVPFFHLCIHWLKKDPDAFWQNLKKEEFEDNIKKMKENL